MHESNDFQGRGALHNQTLFQTVLNDQHLEARRINLPANTVIYEADAPATHVHLIHRGQVRVYQVGDEGASRLCEILGADEWFGVGALAQCGTYGVRVTAVTPTVLTEVRADRLLVSLARRPEMIIDLTRQLAQRVQSAREDAADLMFKDTNHRLLNALVRFARSAASTPREDGVVLNITHSQLAQAVGAARETISLALTQLRQQNLVRTGRNQLFFNPDSLVRLQGEYREIERVERVA